MEVEYREEEGAEGMEVKDCMGRHSLYKTSWVWNSERMATILMREETSTVEYIEFRTTLSLSLLQFQLARQ